ncbi:MAG: PAS domain-containing protein [Deltaproteobacteria bacterium]|nr:PAS domain-containing protein [Deltaproteobacteria bacterium]
MIASLGIKGFERLLANLNDCVMLLDDHLQILSLNPAAERLFGTSQQAASGKDYRHFFKMLPELVERIQQCWVDELSFTIREVEFELRDLKKILLEVHGALLAGEGVHKVGVILIFRDITSFKQFEEEHRLYDRLTLMGTIAAGLAHEIKNPLSGIRAAAEMILREVHAGELQEFPQMIIKEVDRLDKLIVDLLNFTKPKKKKLVPVNVNKVLNEIITLHGIKWKARGIKIQLEMDPSLPQVWGREDELKQAFLNFLKNAVDAMPQEGEIKIVTKIMTDFLVKEASERLQRMVKVEIIDSGVGIPDEHKKSLFAPFFSTKSKGTGLGLMISQKIIHDCGGQLRIESEAKQGTTVQVFLKSV